MRRSVWVVLGVLLVLFRPSVALASDVNLLGTFGNGVSVWNGDASKSVDDRPVPTDSEMMDDEGGGFFGLFSDGRAASDTPLAGIQRFMTRMQRVPINITEGNRSVTLMQAIKFFLTGRYKLIYGANPGSALAVAVLLVFLWWGVRKVVRMIFKSLRKGNLDV